MFSKIKLFILMVLMSLFSTNVSGNYDKLAYDFNFKDLDGSTINLSEYKNKVIVVVNVASQCGFTSQYEGMQEIWEKYQQRGIVMMGVPSNDFGKQEPGDNKEIKNFCEAKFGISFPMTEKVVVKGENAHPFYLWAKKNHGNSAVPKWNFHKIIIGKNGKVEDTFASITKPSSKKFISALEKALD
jgi:glutathione peroxidase